MFVLVFQGGDPRCSHGSGAHCVAQAGFMLIAILRLQPAECLDYRCETLRKANNYIFKSTEPFSYKFYKIFD